MLLPLALLLATALPVEQGLDIQMPVAPVAVPVGGVAMARYELHVTNFTNRPVRIKRITYALNVLEGAALGEAGHGSIAPGMRAIVYVDLPVVAQASPVIVYEVSGVERRITVPAFAVGTGPLPKLGPPVRGGPWVAVYTTDAERGHRRVFYAVAGKAHLPGRFAIDWFKVDDRGRHAARTDARRDDWYGEGADVLAVADGIVAATQDGVAEPATIDEAGPVPIGEAAGNYIAIDIGGGRFAFYEHLKPGLRVRQGQRVRRGDVIAQLGMTGQTTGPHLHFHLANAPSPLDAEGMPYVLEKTIAVGAYASIEAFGQGESWQKQPRRAGAFFPTPNQVVVFPD